MVMAAASIAAEDDETAIAVPIKEMKNVFFILLWVPFIRAFEIKIAGSGNRTRMSNLEG